MKYYCKTLNITGIGFKADTKEKRTWSSYSAAWFYTKSRIQASQRYTQSPNGKTKVCTMIIVKP